MSTTRDFDRIAQTWLADGPVELSDRVLDAALEEVHVTTQRRGFAPWRLTTMTSTFKLAAAAVGVLALVVASALFLSRGSAGPNVGASPTPSAAPSPSASAASVVTYTSARYGFSMVHPPGWVVVPARIDWRINDVHGIGSGWVDELDDPNSGADIFAARQPLEPGTTADEWLDRYIGSKAADAGDICGDMSPEAYQQVDVQGEEGRQITTVCSGAEGINYYAAALVVHDGSAYLISYARVGGEEPGDDEAFARLVESFSFPAE